jgi:hypothetical protein
MIGAMGFAQRFRNAAEVYRYCCMFPARQRAGLAFKAFVRSSRRGAREGFRRKIPAA